MNLFRKTIDYLRSSREEMKKVSWPTRKDTLRFSTLVIGVSVAVAVFFAALDYGSTKLVSSLISYRNQVRAQAAVQQQEQAQTTEAATTTEQPKLDFSQTDVTTVPASGTKQ